MSAKNHSRPHQRSQKGVTLLELLIAVSLVAMLSTGMMVAMRSSVLAYQKTSQRLESNRRVVGVEHILASQLGAAMAVMGLHLQDGGNRVRRSIQISHFHL